MLRRMVPALLVTFALSVSCLNACENPAPVSEVLDNPCDQPPVAPPQPVADDVAARASAELKAKREELARLQAEIRELERRNGEYEYVLMRCRIVELPAELISTLGLETAAEDDSGRRPQTAVISGDLADQVFEALRGQGHAKVVAEASLVTTNGHPAHVLSGGEFPFPVPQKNGEATIEWREFGVSIEAVPEVLGEGRVRVQLVPQYSVRDFSNVIEAEGFVIPGLHVRRIRTQLEAEFGQVLVVLMHTTAEAEQHGVNGEGATDGDASRMVTLFMVTPEPFVSDQPQP
jgi:hypothetical protein